MHFQVQMVLALFIEVIEFLCQYHILSKKKTYQISTALFYPQQWMENNQQPLFRKIYFVHFGEICNFFRELVYPTHPSLSTITS